jgi:hypothetical protein
MSARRTADPVAALAARVAAQAPTLGLALEAEGVDTGKMIGAAFMAAAHTATPAGHAKMPRKAGASDKAAIKALITSWASLHPKQVLANWQKYATSPYTVVGAGKAQRVNGAYLRKWLKSKPLATLMAWFPFPARRTPKLSGIKITWLGGDTAAVTWAEAETATNGRRYKGNAAAIVVKTAKGWRITVTSKQGSYSA